MANGVRLAGREGENGDGTGNDDEYGDPGQRVIVVFVGVEVVDGFVRLAAADIAEGVVGTAHGGGDGAVGGDAEATPEIGMGGGIALAVAFKIPGSGFGRVPAWDFVPGVRGVEIACQGVAQEGDGGEEREGPEQAVEGEVEAQGVSHKMPQ